MFNGSGLGFESRQALGFLFSHLSYQLCLLNPGPSTRWNSSDFPIKICLACSLWRIKLKIHGLRKRNYSSVKFYIIDPCLLKCVPGKPYRASDNQVVCDRMVTKQECFNIPVADCRVGVANVCKMVPRQVRIFELYLRSWVRIPLCRIILV